MNAIGIIFANLHERNIPELTRIRTVGSVPFGCRYRLIDFTLSNMVNSGITDIRVVTQYNYQSLMDHIGSGKDWDLARRSGGIKILPPNMRYNQNYMGGAHSRLESLMGIAASLNHIKEDYVIMADCDGICNIDLDDLLRDHIANNADITMMTKRLNINGGLSETATIIEADESGRITDLAMNPKYAEGEHDVALNITVINTKYLQNIVQEAIAHGFTSLTRDIMMRNKEERIYRIYRYEGAFATISSLEDYFATSMELITNTAFRNALFGVDRRPVLTKVRNSAPTRYTDASVVKNSLIADGCTIDGTVENCILFRGVKIGRGAVVKNCILYQDTVVGENVFMNCVISDKNTVIRDGNVLAGHPSKPYFIGKNQML
ncbi:MAG: glucose-1-phosphate adenylyltransferase subunit GlgD [Ruminococcaceae bacterium]|nr:glucose-1-phosphate adenylyltransferase subunit GlgD [Oscillospiraceae bacterium]